MRATLIGGPFDETGRDVEDPPPDVVLCTDKTDPKREHLYRLRGVEPAGADGLAVYEHAPDGPA